MHGDSAGHSPHHSVRDLTRRELLKYLGAGSIGVGLSAGGSRELHAVPSSPAPLTPPRDHAMRRAEILARPFDLRHVRLLESPFLDAQRRNEEYMLSLDADRLLHNFRVNAGLEPKAPVYGGWESQEPWVWIRCHGHTLGHWLTAGSLMYASTGDERFRERVGYMVDELKLCQDATGNGLVCAFPDGDEQLMNAVRGQRFDGVPWYTQHKIMAGLRDAHVLADNRTALDVLVGLSDWTWNVTSHMSAADWERMLEREHGGMNEVLADVHALTGDERYLTLARHFSHKALLEPLARGDDALDGLHANTQIPKVVGFHRLHELTGEEQYELASAFFWDRVVNARSFVTGGHGDGEHFFPVDEFPRHLQSAKTMETCCTHNMLRLTRMRFGVEPSAVHADFYERALYNGILASQDPDSGWNTYFQATRPGYMKLYHTPIDSFWCCTGSGIENHAKYGDSIYFQSDDELWVNLFIPSELRWEEKGVSIRQTTRFPEEETTRIEIVDGGPAEFAMLIRHPGWTTGATVSVNGSAVPATASADGYIRIDREWRAGDVIEVRFPMTLRTEALPGDPDRVAFVYGPIVLAGRLGTDGLFPGADILRNERTSGDILQVPVDVPVLSGDAASVVRAVRPVPGQPVTFETVGIGRPRDVQFIPYYRMHHERYNLYWQLQRG